jgi:yecA family protein
MPESSPHAQFAPADFTEAEAGALGYCELAGFLFALACSPELVTPSEWIPQVLGEEGEAFDSLEEAQRVVDLTMALHNRINLEVTERKPALPPGIEVRANPMENFGPQAPLGQWAGGCGAGQLWLEETWEACLREEPDAETLDEALGGLNAALSFFTSRELAENWLRKMPALLRWSRRRGACWTGCLSRWPR